MLILKVIIRNLTSLAGEHTIDFTAEPLRSAGLFAITGDTGAGKSTILDAICLALFNRAPRLDNVQRLKSENVDSKEVNTVDARNYLRRGEREGSAIVEFKATNGAHYRATWQVRLKRTGAYDNVIHTLEQLSPNRRTYDKAEVKAKIEEALGLDYAQFSRTVMLAQNSFANFLNAKIEEKSALLEKLTGTEIYGTISKRIYEEKTRAEQQVAELNVEKNTVLRDFMCEEELAEKQQQQALLETTVREMDNQKRITEQQLKWIDDHDEAMLEVKRCEENHAEIYKQYLSLTPERQLLERYDDVISQQTLFNEIKSHQANIEKCKTDRIDVEKAMHQSQEEMEQSRMANDLAVSRLVEANKQLEQRRPDIQRGLKIGGEMKENQILLTQRELDLRKIQEDVVERRNKLKFRQTEAAELQTAINKYKYELQALTVYRSLFDKFDIVKSRLQDLEKEGLHNADCHRTYQEQQVAQTSLRAILDREKKELQRISDLLSTRKSEVALFEHHNSDFTLSQLQSVITQNTSRLALLKSAKNLWVRLTKDYENIDLMRSKVNASRIAIEQLSADLQVAQRNILVATENFNKANENFTFHSSQNIEAMRKNLKEGSPCPVCGGTHHPYHTESARELGKIFEDIERRYKETSEILEEAKEKSRSIRASLASVQGKYEEEQRNFDALHQQLHFEEEEWKQYEALDVTFRECSSAVNANLRLITIEQLINNTENNLQQQQAELSAYNANQESINNLNRIIRELSEKSAQQAQQIADIEAQLKISISKQRDAKQQIDVSDRRLKELYIDLDNIILDSSWMARWRSNPEQYLLSLQDLYNKWTRTSKLLEEHCQKLELADNIMKSEDNELQIAIQAENAAREYRDGTRELLRIKQDELTALFGLQTPEEVEQALLDVISQASAQQQATKFQLDAAKAKLDEATGTKRKLEQDYLHFQQLYTQQSGKLDCWMAAYNREHSPLRFAELEEIFTDTRDWNALRRNILQCKEQLTVAQNTRNLAEQNLARIRQDTMRPDSAKGETRESLKAALLDTNARIAESSERLGQIKALIERHEKALHETALMQSRIKAAEDNNEWWQRLNTMFGSADGKKFREIAQSFTFEHLVMRANEQLLQLSPRYRLCTIPGTLMLQIIDRDMFDQQRYVSSLSGGETFVVSLALALALSGLSAEGLTIGSLFIDEGFGNLDNDSLNLVMQALANLQAGQGRKVGIISHTEQIRTQISPRINVEKRPIGGESIVRIEV